MLEEFTTLVGITPLMAGVTVLGTIVIYAMFVLILHTLGQRIYATPSNVEIAIVAILGAIVGRTTLGPYPTLAGGVIALATLVVLELSLGAVRRHPRVRSRDSDYRAVAIMINGHWQEDILLKYNMNRVTLWSTLRERGIQHPDQVAAMILEPNGHFSIIKQGATVHPDALTGLRNHRAVARELGVTIPVRSTSATTPTADCETTPESHAAGTSAPEVRAPARPAPGAKKILKAGAKPVTTMVSQAAPDVASKAQPTGDNDSPPTGS